MTERRPAIGGGAPSREIRPEIQALRALAVGLVVVYHLLPDTLTGGYIGVDVFFAISGFLITAHLLREVQRTGRLSITQFWARRIRRLLPAAFTVLLFCLVAAVVWVPEAQRQDTLTRIGASALYIVNWVLSSDSVDYLAADNLPTIVQHYWSLSIEEQFYIAWPLLIVLVLAGTAVVARVRNRSAATVGTERRSTIVAIGVVLAVLTVVSLVLSVTLTNTSRASAYFLTTTRVWEFAAGGLLAVAGVIFARAAPWMIPSFVRATASLVGVALIVGSAFVLDANSAFPGWRAIVPVVGTLLVIAAGEMSAWWSPKWIANLRPVQFLGDISYSVYLWHWPLIVLAPLVLGAASGPLVLVGVIVLTLALATATKYFIEDPVRVGQSWTQRRWPAYSFLAGGMTLVIGLTGGQMLQIQAANEAFARTAHADARAAIPCFGAAAMNRPADCSDPFAVSERVKPIFATSDKGSDWCMIWPGGADHSCEYGVADDPQYTVALVGDSHAQMLVDPLAEIAEREGWRLIVFSRFGCPALSTTPIDVVGRTEEDKQACAGWSARVLEQLRTRDDIDAIVFHNLSEAYSAKEIPPSGRLEAATVEATWRDLIATGKRVVLVRDVPATGGRNIPTCIEASGLSEDPCTTPREEAVPEAQVVLAARAMPDDVPLIDLTDHFCDDSMCHTVIGDVIAYFDDNHMSATFALTLVPYLEPLLQEALGR
jgi:peptidoglycan/LPS O-acetylase OafA/YrhL